MTDPLGVASETWDAMVLSHERRASWCPKPEVRHQPIAAVLSCSDARVSPARVFDMNTADLFAVRIAGNSPAPEAVASLSYAVTVLGVPLVVVLGHTYCGAVTAAFEGNDDPALAPIVAPIRRVLERHGGGQTADHGSALNVIDIVERLQGSDSPVGEASRYGRLSIVGAVHHIETGYLEVLPT